VLRLYDYHESGNAYKVRLLLSQLEGKNFFVGDRYSVADIALFAYTQVAHEGGFELERYRNISAWLLRVADQPGHVGIEEEVGTLVSI
jgi:glutathione S-transferase